MIPPRPLAAWAALALLAPFIAACHTLPKASVGKSSATAPKDNGTPATVETIKTTSRIEIPSGSIINHSTCAATPTTPAIDQTKITLSDKTTLHLSRDHTTATTGVIDTTIAKHRIDSDQKQILLWAAIIGLLSGILLRSLLPAWPGLSNGALVFSALTFAAWKFEQVPWWAGCAVLAIMIVLALGYKRAEWDANKNLIPDILEKKPTT